MKYRKAILFGSGLPAMLGATTQIPNAFEGAPAYMNDFRTRRA